MKSPESLPADARVMHTTCWTVVLEASRPGEESAGALEQLCRLYWPAVFGYLIRSGMEREAAQDETQDFFADLLRREGLAGVSPEKGRFRSFLLTCLKNHLANARRDEARLKRGGGQSPVPLDDAIASGIAREAITAPEPEAAYDRQWAESVMQQTHARLGAEYTAAGRPERFAALREYLMWDGGENTGRELAAKLGESETAVRSAIYRMRRRFARLMREQIAATLAPGEDVEEEVRYLARVLA